MFFEQYWGGPTTYSEQRGHPRLRMRHLPFQVTPDMRDRWLLHMMNAVDTLELSPENDDRLRDNLRTQLNALMAQLFAQGCFAGSTPEESWFVRVASVAEAALELDAGRLVAEVGVAPAEPTEFIVIRVAVQAEGEIKSSFAPGAGVNVGD